MTSENYRIQNSVQSGGGTATISDNYQMNSTLGQSSPLLDPADPPFSDFYDLYPGFWYTLKVPECECDLNTDGVCDMQDYFLFGQDWGRTDCPLS